MVTKPCKTRRIQGFRRHPEPWPPAGLRLPDTIEAIEAGRPGVQRSLFGPDDSRGGRLARLLADVPGVVTAADLDSTAEKVSYGPQQNCPENRGRRG
jgi:hypothetical protein